MFSLGGTDKFLLYVRPTDMRKGFDGLCGLVANDLGQDPVNGSVYIFINRARDRAKLLHWRPGGFVLYYKRLESGTFERPVHDENTCGLRLGYAQLVMLMDGITIANITRRKRHKKA